MSYLMIENLCQVVRFPSLTLSKSMPSGYLPPETQTSSAYSISNQLHLKAWIHYWAQWVPSKLKAHPVHQLYQLVLQALRTNIYLYGQTNGRRRKKV